MGKNPQPPGVETRNTVKKMSQAAPKDGLATGLTQKIRIRVFLKISSHRKGPSMVAEARGDSTAGLPCTALRKACKCARRSAYCAFMDTKLAKQVSYSASEEAEVLPSFSSVTWRHKSRQPFETRNSQLFEVGFLHSTKVVATLHAQESNIKVLILRNTTE